MPHLTHPTTNHCTPGPHTHQKFNGSGPIPYPRPKAKLAPKWLGPYRVITQVGPVNYDIVLEDSGEDKSVVPIARLRPCYPTVNELEKLLDIFNEDHDEFLGFPYNSPSKGEEEEDKVKVDEQPVLMPISSDIDVWSRAFESYPDTQGTGWRQARTGLT